MSENFETNFLIKKLEKIFLKKTYYGKLFLDYSLYKMFTKNLKIKGTNFSEKNTPKKQFLRRMKQKKLKHLKLNWYSKYFIIWVNRDEKHYLEIDISEFFRMKIEKQIYYYLDVFAEARAMDSCENHIISWRKRHYLRLAEKSLFGRRFSMCATIGVIQIRIFFLKRLALRCKNHMLCENFCSFFRSKWKNLGANLLNFIKDVSHFGLRGNFDFYFV